MLADLPLGETPVCLRLHERRFRCVNAPCPCQTFRERLSDLASRYQRRTPVLPRHLEAVSCALGGQARQRSVQRLHLVTLGAHGTSRTSLLHLLRLIRRAPLHTVSEVSPHLRRLGVDDFAFQCGLRYGRYW